MATPNPVRKWTLVVLALCVVFLLYSLIADRLTPYTSQAVAQAYIVGIAPEVAGLIIEIDVEDNQLVKAGQTLFRIDSEPYQIAVEQAEAKLATVGLTIGASTAGVASAEAELAEMTARRDNTREQTARVFELVKKGTYAAARGDTALAESKAAEAALQQAKAELDRARESLGPKGADNPQLREAMAALQQARLDLSHTDVLAPSDGLVTNLQLTTGQYAAQGQPLLAFIDIRDYWVSAEFRENSLGNVKPGEQAEITFDVLPGRIYQGTVENIGWAVARGQTGAGSMGALPTVKNQTGWVRDPQRFPVRIDVAGKAPPGVRYNAQANVIIYAGGNPITDGIGWFWIRLVSLLSYVS
ncbi:MAG TPA: HlyD family secretion protein [Dongiaceae bacterium]